MSDRPQRRPKAKKIPLTTLLTVPVVILGLVFLLASCSGKEDPRIAAQQAKIEELESEIQYLEEQVEELNEKSIKLSNRVLELMSQKKLTPEDIALINTQLDIIASYADRLPDEAQKALNNIIEYLNSK